MKHVQTEQSAGEDSDGDSEVQVRKRKQVVKRGSKKRAREDFEDEIDSDSDSEVQAPTNKRMDKGKHRAREDVEDGADPQRHAGVNTAVETSSGQQLRGSGDDHLAKGKHGARPRMIQPGATRKVKEYSIPSDDDMDEGPRKRARVEKTKDTVKGKPKKRKVD